MMLVIRDQRLMWLLWPSFLMACFLEVLIYAVVDPDWLEFLGRPIECSRSTVYSISFFIFWISTSISSALTTLLSQSPFERNRCPLNKNERPSECPKEAIAK